MKETRDREGGMVIVEASIVFPVMFLVIFLMLFAGNAYLQKCRVDSYVTQLALDGAAYCADPMVRNVIDNTIPNVADLEVYPYRYFDPDGVGDIRTTLESEIQAKITNLSTGLFSGMKPKNPKVSATYNNHFICGTFSVSVEYKIQLPVRLLGSTENISMHLASFASMPVSDSPEFIRNMDMVEDYMDRYGISEKIDELKAKLEGVLTKAKEWFN